LKILNSLPRAFDPKMTPRPSLTAPRSSAAKLDENDGDSRQLEVCALYLPILASSHKGECRGVCSRVWAILGKAGEPCDGVRRGG